MIGLSEELLPNGRIEEILTSLEFNVNSSSSTWEIEVPEHRRSKDVSIDADIIEEYFLGKHDQVVDERFELMGDFDPERCRIYEGTIISINDDKALVKLEKKESEYRTDFVSDVKVGDKVIVHRDFVVKII